MNPTNTLGLVVVITLSPTAWSGSDHSHNNQVSIKQTDNEICIDSNGLPNHSTGTFPNKGNPHSIKEQDFSICLTNSPEKTDTENSRLRAIGVMLNGVLIRPGTADYYDGDSRRGFSRDSSSGWRLDGMGAAELLGMDENNAHVDHNGIYHYHGSPTGLLSKNSEAQSSDSHIGYAADGFEIHYIGEQAKSGYQLKNGKRPTEPFGNYDGTYVQDWQYVGGDGTLDQCNGGMLNGQYVYFATDSYPYYPHCLWGEVSSDFRRF